MSTNGDEGRTDPSEDVIDAEVVVASAYPANGVGAKMPDITEPSTTATSESNTNKPATVSAASSSSREQSDKDIKAAIRAEVQSLSNQNNSSAQTNMAGAVSVSGAGLTSPSRGSKAAIKAEMASLKASGAPAEPGAVAVGASSVKSPVRGSKAAIKKEMASLKASGAPVEPGAVAVGSSNMKSPVRGSKAAIKAEMASLKASGAPSEPGAMAVGGSSMKSPVRGSKAAIKAEMASLKASSAPTEPGAMAVGGSSAKSPVRDSKEVIKAEMAALQESVSPREPGVISVDRTTPKADEDSKAVIKNEMEMLQNSVDAAKPGAVSVAPKMLSSADRSNSRSDRASRKARMYAANDKPPSGRSSARDEAVAVALDGSEDFKEQQVQQKIRSSPQLPAVTESRESVSSSKASLSGSAVGVARMPSKKDDVSADFTVKSMEGKEGMAGVATKTSIQESMDEMSLKEKLKQIEAETGVIAAEIVDERKLEAEFHAKIMSSAVTAEVVTEEELKAQESGGRWKLYSCILVLIAVIVGVVVGLTAGKTTDISDSDYLIELLTPISGDALLNTSTVQYRAFDWLLNNDTLLAPIKKAEERELIQRYSVATFYYSLGGERWTSQFNFLSDTSVCEWNDGSLGVFCDSSDNSTTRKIEMGANNVDGTIPRDLAGLSTLEILSLTAVGNLYGTLPSELGNINTMSFLQLVALPLSGAIPETFTQLTNIQTLNLYATGLSGALPANLFAENDALRYLVMGNCAFTGSLPSLKRQSPVQVVVVENNQFEGTIPSSFFQQPAMEQWHFSNNKLSGSIAQQIAALSKLTIVKVDGNQLTGTIPSAVGSLEDIVQLMLSSNSLSGTIPTQLANCDKLQILDLSNNQLSGELPSELGSLDKLVTLDLSSNDFVGDVPSSYAELTGLSDADFSSTALEGGFETSVCSNPSIIANIHADCGGSVPEVSCECCSTCCSDDEGCLVNLVGVCSTNANKLEVEADRGTSCSCLEDGSSVFCSETCQSCNLDGSVCAVSNQLSYEFDAETGEATVFQNTFQYVVGRNENVTFTQTAGSDNCEVEVNGEKCQLCDVSVCKSGSEGFVIDCSNIGGVNLDTCVEMEAGYLELFYFTDPSLLSGCEPLLDVLSS
eukprot:Nitzschia sp. Nitz4//scaffold173_size47512//7783//11234//NITZ4_007153-RA/size47512-processed-gene-0.13-mRNA-1//1//CDS//3329538787//5371//frame0